MTNRGDDGRNIDDRLGVLSGEGAQQRVPAARAETEGAPGYGLARTTPPGPLERSGTPTYYDRPVLKEPVWIWAVPAYFYAGGAAGAAATLAAAAQAVDGEVLRGLVVRGRWIAAAGTTAGTALLIYDLGRPERFLNMLRVVRPTSPLNLGSWLLSAATTLSVVAAITSARRMGLGERAGLAAGIVGMPLAGYTAMLLSNTAVPIWQQTGRTMPALFASSSAASAGALLQMMHLGEREKAVVDRFTLAARVAEVASSFALERDAGRTERVASPLHEGFSGALWRASKLCAAGSIVVSVAPGLRDAARYAGAVLGTFGALALRLAIFKAGFASTRDPRATFEQQRAGMNHVRDTTAEGKES